MDQINSGEKPYKTIEYTGLYGKIYKTDFIVRTFCNKDGFGYSKKSLNVYNDNNEYEKTTYKNNLIVETKKVTKNGFTIVKKRYNKDKLLIGVRIDDGIESKYQYDSHKRLVKIYNKEKVLKTYEYDDQNRTLVIKGTENTFIEFHDGDDLIKYKNSYNDRHNIKKEILEFDDKENQTIRHYGDWGDVCKEESYFEGKKFFTREIEFDIDKGIYKGVVYDYDEEEKRVYDLEYKDPYDILFL